MNSPFFIKFLNILFFVLMWQICSWLLGEELLPGLFTCLQKTTYEQKTLIFVHLSYSLLRTFSGLLLGSFLGISCGLLLGSLAQLDRIFAPLLFFTYTIPKAVLVPILLIVFGIGDLSKIVLIAIVVFYQMAVSARDGAKQVDIYLLHAFDSMSASKWRKIWHVVLPAALPKIFTAFKISLATSLALLFFFETYATQYGIGFYIWDSFAQFDYALVYLASFVFALCGFGLNELVLLAEKKCMPWMSI